ncbi:DUF3459 domain-containing protein [Actinophytocola oryzae]|uniref:alpha-amylase family glycosyl hydrolase n=1 Tax=Actinophytocola oryzae TaxID=502181 RepID=UPI001AB01E0A|nr:DUF3459 domain-containing protein [Actinophytocola oryzae]
MDDRQLRGVFDFALMEALWEARSWRTRIAEAEAAYGPSRAPAWVLSSHDQPRHRTRHVDREDRARVAAAVLLTLRGMPFVYAGEELGLGDAVVPPERRRDPLGRDGSRAPIPWTAAAGHGWASPDPWPPWPPHASTRNAETLRADEPSILWLYRRLIALRRTHPDLVSGDLTLLDGPREVLAYRRGDFTVLANFADHPVRVPYRGRVLLTSGREGLTDDTLAPCTAVVVAGTR